MSGPKVDTAALRAQERGILAAARNERKNLASGIDNLMEQVNCILKDDLEFMMQDENLRPVCEKIIEHKKQCLKELRKNLSIVKVGTEALNIQEIEANSQQLVRDLNKKIAEEEELIKTIAAGSVKFQALESNRKNLENARKKNIIRLTEAVEETEELVSQEDIDELVNVFEDEVNQFMSENQMTTKHKNSVLLISQDLQDIVNSNISLDRKEKRLKRLFKDYQSISALITDEMAEMNALYKEYVKECFDISAPVMEISEFKSKKDIENVIITARELAETKMSKEYIKRQIDEVMAKHGYDVIKSDMLSESNEKGQILYGVDSDSAIDVFVSDDNQVTMRVVGIGFDSNISEAENEKLFQKQCAFCSMHPQITAELAMRGVILETKKHLPPDRKFNKKIQTKSKSSSQSVSKAKKLLKKSELKTMHRE
jgi:hypothetical protein